MSITFQTLFDNEFLSHLKIACLLVVRCLMIDIHGNFNPLIGQWGVHASPVKAWKNTWRQIVTINWPYLMKIMFWYMFFIRKISMYSLSNLSFEQVDRYTLTTHQNEFSWRRSALEMDSPRWFLWDSWFNSWTPWEKIVIPSGVPPTESRKQERVRPCAGVLTNKSKN